MNTNTIVGVVVALVIVGGGAWYLSTHQQGGEAAPAATEETAQQGTFADLMMRTGSWKCETAAEFEGGVSEGTVVMNDGKLRGDFTSTVEGRTVATSFISTEGYMYTWSDVLPQGMKVKVDAAAGTAGGEGIDPSTNVNYSCAPWSTDASVFVIPSNIQFFDLSAEGGAGVQMPY